MLAVAALSAAESNEFTIATWNVLYRNRDLPKVVEVIRQTQADLVALQETNADSEAALRRELAREYPYMMFRGGRGSDGFGFLAKTPLRNLKFVEPLPGWRGCWIAEVSLAGTNIQVASVHLATPRLGEMKSITSVLAAFQKAEDLHVRETARIYEQLSQQMPVIVLGDFNSFSFFHAPKFLGERGWVDSFASATPNADQQGTWRFRSGETELTFRIDYIFHTADLRTVNSRILKSEVSDHYPVVSRLKRVRP